MQYDINQEMLNLQMQQAFRDLAAGDMLPGPVRSIFAQLANHVQTFTGVQRPMLEAQILQGEGPATRALKNAQQWLGVQPDVDLSGSRVTIVGEDPNGFHQKNSIKLLNWLFQQRFHRELFDDLKSLKLSWEKDTFKYTVRAVCKQVEPTDDKVALDLIEWRIENSFWDATGVFNGRRFIDASAPGKMNHLGKYDVSISHRLEDVLIRDYNDTHIGVVTKFFHDELLTALGVPNPMMQLIESTPAHQSVRKLIQDEVSNIKQTYQQILLKNLTTNKVEEVKAELREWIAENALDIPTELPVLNGMWKLDRSQVQRQLDGLERELAGPWPMHLFCYSLEINGAPIHEDYTPCTYLMPLVDVLTQWVTRYEEFAEAAWKKRLPPELQDKE